MKYLKPILILAIIVVLLFFFLKGVEFEKVMKIIGSVDLIYPALFFLGLYVQFYVRAYRWGLLLKPHKKKISIFTLYSYTVIGFLLNLLPGKVGEPARGILLAREEGFSRSYGLASVVLERLIDMIMMLVLFMASLFFMPQNNDFKLLVDLKKVAFIVFPLLLGFLLYLFLLNNPFVFKKTEQLIIFLSRILPAGIREKLTRFGLNFLKGLRLNLSFWDYIKLLVSSSAVWLFLIPFYWILMQGFGFGKEVTLFETIPYFCVLVASASIPTPGMAGSFEAASRIGLEQFYGVSNNEAVAYTILSHFLILAVMVIPGLIAFWTRGLHLKMVKDIKGQAEEDKQELKIETKNTPQVGGNQTPPGNVEETL
jgi:glycosyltransferase 2 family protein